MEITKHLQTLSAIVTIIGVPFIIIRTSYMLGRFHGDFLNVKHALRELQKRVGQLERRSNMEFARIGKTLARIRGGRYL
jgi:hypothetical protein